MSRLDPGSRRNDRSVAATYLENLNLLSRLTAQVAKVAEGRKEEKFRDASSFFASLGGLFAFAVNFQLSDGQSTCATIAGGRRVLKNAVACCGCENTSLKNASFGYPARSMPSSDFSTVHHSLIACPLARINAPANEEQ